MGIGPQEQEFLSTHVMWNTYLMVIRSDGTPTGYPMLTAHHEGRLEFTTYRSAAKTRRILANPRLCCVLRTRADEVPRAIAVWGDAIEAADDGDNFMSRPVDEQPPIVVPGAMRSSVNDRLENGKRMLFKMPIDRAQFLLLPPALVAPSPGGDHGTR
ncbi:MAG: hypothetical protein AB7V43_14230 [Acidimicrobiia bacterium]